MTRRKVVEISQACRHRDCFITGRDKDYPSQKGQDGTKGSAISTPLSFVHYFSTHFLAPGTDKYPKPFINRLWKGTLGSIFPHIFCERSPYV